MSTEAISDMPEIRCSSKQNTGFYVRTGRQFLLGTAGRDGEPGKVPVDEIALTGLGAAITHCIGAAARLEKAGVARIIKVTTDFPKLKQDEDGRPDRGVAQIRIELRVIPESRKNAHHHEQHHDEDDDVEEEHQGH